VPSLASCEGVSLGQYKVPQNVEAEDKIIGPLTFKQFIYAIIGVFWGLLSFALLRKLIPVMIVVGFPPTLLFLLLAFFTRDGQNFEQLLIALVSFTVNPRRRLWSKDDVGESFKVEPTKHEAEQTQRNPADVRSQLERIASMVDSRGWETPVASSAFQPATAAAAPTAASTPTALATEPPPSEDILDLQNSPQALNLSQLINTAAQDVRQEAMEQMKEHAVRVTGVQPAPAVTAQSSSGILQLATESDDLTVSQLATTATHLVPPEPVPQGMENNGSN